MIFYRMNPLLKSGGGDDTSIYGVEWDGSSITGWTRTDDSTNFPAPNPYYSGMSSSPSSPFDDISPWKDMVVSERTGGTMVAIPKFYYNITRPSGSSAGLKIQISMHQHEGFLCSPAHMNRGDGAGERDVIYVGRYHSNSTNYKSATGASPYVNATRSSMRTTLHNLDSKLWQFDFATRFTLWLLYLVEFADWNSQDKIGYGCSTSGSVMTMGYTDNMGYHTGTTASSRTSYGGTQYRNIEGLWDNVYDWLDGAYYNSSGLNIILNPSNFSDSSGGIAVGVPSNGYPSAFDIKDVSNTYKMILPTAANGSESTYSCDYWYYSASDPCLCGGGNYGQNLDRGLFFVYRAGTSSANAGRGCRLLELP